MIITWDAETFFADDYSLSKMTTEEYVRDRRFKLHGFAIKFDAAPAEWFDPGELRGLSLRQEIENAAVLCHHAQFDGLILNHHYGLRPKLWLDTLSMARIALPHHRHSLDKLSQTFGLPGKQHHKLADVKNVRDPSPAQMQALGEMACDDADKTYIIFQKIKDYIPRDEFQVIDQTIRMFTEPCLRLDEPKMKVYHSRIVAEKRDTLAELGVSREELQSADKFANILKGLGVEPATKPGKHGPIYAFAKTDEAMRELLEHDDGRIATVAAARLGIKSTIDETRCERLLSMSSRGRLPVYLRYAGAHTTRWSGGDSLNWQNFPNRKDTTIRQAVEPPPGCKAVVADSSQIQCRILNWLAGQQDVIARFERKEDPYLAPASRFYGREITRADKPERQFGKVLELGCGFQMGPVRFKEICRIGPLGMDPIILSDDEAHKGVYAYRDTHPFVVQLWKNCEWYLNVLAEKGNAQLGPLEIADGAVWLPNGLPMWYDNHEWRPNDNGEMQRWVMIRGRWTTMYGGKFTENVVQALERVLIADAMLRIGRKYRVVNVEHDGLWIIAPKDDDQCLPFCCSELSITPEWANGLPLDAEGSEGERYAK